jgi:hypothetical protein
MIDNVDNILQELEDSWEPPQTPNNIQEPPPREEDLMEYTIQKTAALLEMGLQTTKELKDAVLTAQDPEEIAALSELMNATSRTAEALMKISLQNKKHKQNLELVQAKNENMAIPLQINNNIGIVASRQEIMDKVLELEVQKTMTSHVIEDETK